MTSASMVSEARIEREERVAARGGDVLAFGFGTTVAMWAVGYVCRFPPAIVPSWLLLVLLLVCLIGGGFVAGGYGARGVRGGVYAGGVAGVLNLLVLGSLLMSHESGRLVPSALAWIPGSVLVSVVLSGAGAALGVRYRSAEDRKIPRNWTAAFTKVAAAATLLLLIAGGVVTGAQAGLAVVDWPNSYGYNMFFYPLAKMTGGIYYEHAHRLLGSLVGLTTLVLAIHLQRTDHRAWLRRFGWAAVFAVIVQGLLGGLRVTGYFTLSQSAAETAPSITLAIVHGVFGQIFFGMMIALMVFTSTRWMQPAAPIDRPSLETDRSLSVVLVVVLLVQLVFGAVFRHVQSGLLIHISLAAFVLLVALAVALRAWGLYESHPTLTSLGRWLMVLVLVQIGLGIAALIATGWSPSEAPPTIADVVFTTAHQACGAVLLAASVMLMLWYRRFSPSDRGETAGTPPTA